MRRTAALAALAACSLVAVPLGAPTGAATRPLVLRDVAGDANMVNDQQSGLPVPEQQTGDASLASDDIVSLAVTTRYEGRGGARRPASLAFTLTLADGPDLHSTYAVDALVLGGCTRPDYTSLSLVFASFPSVGGDGATCSKPGSTSSKQEVSSDEAEVDVAKHTITWTVAATALKPGVLLEGFIAQSSVAAYPVVDQLVGAALYRFP